MEGETPLSPSWRSPGGALDEPWTSRRAPLAPSIGLLEGGASQHVTRFLFNAAPMKCDSRVAWWRACVACVRFLGLLTFSSPKTRPNPSALCPLATYPPPRLLCG